MMLEYEKISGFADDGHGRWWIVWLGAVGTSYYVVRCDEGSILDAAYDASEGGYFEPIEYPDQDEGETDEEYWRRCESAETDLSIVSDAQMAIPSWEWGYREANNNEIREWKIWFANLYL